MVDVRLSFEKRKKIIKWYWKFENVAAVQRQWRPRQAARESDVSASSVLRILRKDKFHVYIPRLVQQLSDDDPDRRLEFCEWVQERVKREPGFVGGIIWSDLFFQLDIKLSMSRNLAL
ncbi:transposable element tc3 transposase [Biomphalaria glabrata]|nr:transposable element tc3 transposase [Biomphalaria glabrata]